MTSPDKKPFGPFTICANCQKSAVAICDESFDNFFGGDAEPCHGCGVPVDLYASLVGTLDKNIFAGMNLAPVGARFTQSEVTLEQWQMQQLRFSDHGVPHDARVIEIQYGGLTHGFPPRLENTLFPVEFNGPLPYRHEIPPDINLIPIPFGSGPHAPTACSIVVVWLPHAGDDVPRRLLCDAFVRYGERNYEDAIIPANTAVEAALSAWLSEFLSPIASSELVSRFLADGATYSHQLNVVLPLIISLRNLPRLPDSIRGVLNRLRKFRNKLGHNGKLEGPLDRRSATELLVSAAFGLHYVRRVRHLTLESYN
jgi:hypothetical protein